MPFPNTSILDNFNRANEGPPPSANWTGTVVTGDGSFTVTSNTAQLTNGTVSSAWWSAATFGPDCEAYATITTGGGGFAGVFFRLASPGTAGVDGYLVQANDSSNLVGIFRVDNGSFTLLGATISQAVASGDSVGASMIGSTITAYFKVGAGAWASIGTRTSSTYSAAGNIGLRAGNTSPVNFDDFGGGTVVTFGPGWAVGATKTIGGVF